MDVGVPLKNPVGEIGPQKGYILEHGSRMVYAGQLSSLGLGLEDGHVPTFRLLLYGAFTHTILCPTLPVTPCLTEDDELMIKIQSIRANIHTYIYTCKYVCL